MEPVTKTCEFCHKSFVLTKSSSSFAPDQLEKANDLSNLVTLCWPCHKKVEVGILPCP